MTAIAGSKGTFHEILIARKFDFKQRIIPDHLLLMIIRRFSAAMFSLALYSPRDASLLPQFYDNHIRFTSSLASLSFSERGKKCSNGKILTSRRHRLCRSLQWRRTAKQSK
jgi:hypothetical protein